MDKNTVVRMIDFLELEIYKIKDNGTFQQVRDIIEDLRDIRDEM